MPNLPHEFVVVVLVVLQEGLDARWRHDWRHRILWRLHASRNGLNCTFIVWSWIMWLVHEASWMIWCTAEDNLAGR